MPAQRDALLVYRLHLCDNMLTALVLNLCFWLSCVPNIVCLQDDSLAQYTPALMWSACTTFTAFTPTFLLFLREELTVGENFISTPPLRAQLGVPRRPCFKPGMRRPIAARAGTAQATCAGLTKDGVYYYKPFFSETPSTPVCPTEY